jgi:DNA-binding NarL/FixJ family response regulator
MPKPKANILIVDDEPAQLALLIQQLTQSNYKVHLHQTAHQTLRYLPEIQPDLILLDVVLPDMDGFVLCQKLIDKGLLGNVPVIFITNLSDTKHKLQGLGLKAVDYITKPFEVEEVLARLDRHLTIFNLRRQLEAKNKRLQAEISKSQQLAEDLKRYADQNAQLLGQEKETRRLISVLRQTMLSLSVYLDEDIVRDKILIHLEQLISYDWALLYQPQNESLLPTAAWGQDLSRHSIPLSDSLPITQAFHSQQIIHLNKAPTAPSDLLSNVQNAPSEWAVPLVYQGQSIAVMHIYRLSDADLNSLTQAALQAFANQAAIVLKNAQLRQAAQEAALAEERQRLSQALHDEFAQHLEGLSTHSQQLAADLNAANFSQVDNLAPAQTELAKLQNLLQKSRQAIEVDVANPPLETVADLNMPRTASGFVEGLQLYLDTLLTTFNLHIDLSLASNLSETPLNPGVAVELRAIIKSILDKVRQQAQPPTVGLNLYANEVGFHLNLILSAPHGNLKNLLSTAPETLFGLTNLQQRVKHIGGQLVFKPATNQQFVIQVQVPTDTNACLSSDSELMSLTPRRRQILAMVAKGLTYKEVAQQLYLSERTVRYHIQKTVEALNLNNRQEAIQLARQEGLA